MIDSVLGTDENYFLQVFLEEHKYVAKEKKILNILLTTYKYLLILIEKILVKKIRLNKPLMKKGLIKNVLMKTNSDEENYKIVLYYCFVYKSEITINKEKFSKKACER